MVQFTNNKVFIRTNQILIGMQRLDGEMLMYVQGVTMATHHIQAFGLHCVKDWEWEHASIDIG